MKQRDAVTIVQTAWNYAMYKSKGMTKAQHKKAKYGIGTAVDEFIRLPVEERSRIFGPLRRLYPNFPINQDIIDIAIGK